MIVYFLTKQPDVCQYLTEQLKINGNLAFTFTEFEELYTAITISGKQKVDLLAVDYRIVQHDIFDLHQMLIDQNFVIPLIYYNDPYPEPSERVSYWQTQNRTRFSTNLSETTIVAVRPLLTMIAALIDSPQLNPYISLVNKPLSLQEERAKDVSHSFDLTAFRLNNHIQASRYKLFCYLYQHRDTPLTAKDICLFMWNDYSPKKLRTLYTYIHELRILCTKEKSCTIKIELVSKETYRLLVIASKSELPVHARAEEYLNNNERNLIQFETISPNAEHTSR